jgi:hypothetical protein
MTPITRLIATTIAFSLAGAATEARQASLQIQNGRVETRTATSLDREIAAAAASAIDQAVWVAWREPMIDGARNMCSFYSDRDYPNGIRGDVLDGGMNGDWRPPQIAPSTAPAQLEGGTEVVMLARIVDKRIERLHTIGDDCPIDANGRTVFVLAGITPAESLRYLETLLRPDYANMTRGGAQSLITEASAALALHKDAGADTILDQLATADSDATTRQRAMSLLGTNRGAHGFDTLRRLLSTDHATTDRRAIVTAIASTRQPTTGDVLLDLAKNDPDAEVRAKAVYYVPARSGDRAISDVVAIVDKDPNTTVKEQGVAGLGQLPKDGGLTALIQLARTSTNATVRKAAVTQIGRSKDPRAVAFLEEIIAR